MVYDSGLSVIEVDQKEYLKQKNFEFGAMKPDQWAEQAEEEKYLWCNSFRSRFGNAIDKYAKQYNIPLVHTYHTMYEDYVHYITKGYFNRSSKKIAKYLTLFYCDKTANELIVPTKKIYSQGLAKIRTYERAGFTHRIITK